MSKIEYLLKARAEADPSFQYAQEKDPQTGQFYLLNQLIFTFGPDPSNGGEWGTPILESIQQYVNDAAQNSGQTVELDRSRTRIITKTDSVKVIAVGSNISLVKALDDAIEHDPRPTSIDYDHILFIETVLPESLFII